MPIKITWIVVISLFTAILALSVYRDILADRQFPGDLRNRVVGARMIKDGRSPYFYKWQAGDGTRYYDPNNFDTLKVSNATATPFFHQLMEPLAELPEHQVSKWWLLIEYVMFLVILALAFFFSGSVYGKWAVLVTGGIFLLTEGWQMHVTAGQYYLCIPFMSMLFYCSVKKKTQLLWALVGGIIAVSLVLMRPNALIFFLPFLLLVKNYSRGWLIAFVIPVLAILLWTGLSTQQRFLWQDYRLHVAEQVKVHQGLHPTLQQNTADPVYAEWEGISLAAIHEEAGRHKITLHSENGNLFVVVNSIFHTKLSLGTIWASSIAALVLLTGMFYYSVRGNHHLQPAHIALMGFCLFMVTDLFSPVYRHQYYTVQWLFPVLLAAACFSPRVKWPYLLIGTGLLLNCVNIPFIKMEHTIGEYILFAGLIALVMNNKTKQLQ